MIKVHYAGLYTTIQDTGRFGYRNIGVPSSGAMDSISAAFANALLNNHKNDAVLEITLIGPKLLFLEATNIVVTGAEMSTKLNNRPIINYKVHTIQKGDVLSFGRLIYGTRCYLAVKGGFLTQKILNSRSFYSGIMTTGLLKKNDEIPFNSKLRLQQNQIGIIKIKNQFYDIDTIDVFKGPEFDLFSPEEQLKLISTMYTVSNDTNRMGYRLLEEVVKHSKSMITSPVLPGTVQLTSSGKLIILMKDAQTTGGYPRIFQLSEKSIAVIAQKKVGDKLCFSLIS